MLIVHVIGINIVTKCVALLILMGFIWSYIIIVNACVYSCGVCCTLSNEYMVCVYIEDAITVVLVQK
jgi:hypothetical protein